MDTRDDDAMSEHSGADGMDFLVPTFTDDGHLDEGTIHAWLDGAFDVAQSATVEAHVSACAECRALVAEARGFIAGASRMVRALDAVPADVVPAADVARTASRIVAAADATRVVHKGGASVAQSPSVERVRRAEVSRRPWYAPRGWSAAAALLVMAAGGSYVWQRLGETRVSDMGAAPAQSSMDSSVQVPADSSVQVPAPAAAEEAEQRVAMAASQAPVPAPSPSPSPSAPTLAPEVPASAKAPALAKTERSTDLARERTMDKASEANVAESVAGARGRIGEQTASTAAAAAGRSASMMDRAPGAGASATNRVVTGVVVDPSSLPVEGAIVAAGGAPSTTTNARGEFMLTLPVDSATLSVKRLGYTASNVAISARGADTARARVTLVPSTLTLSAVTIVNTKPAAASRAQGAASEVTQRRDEAPPSQCWSVQGEPGRVGLRLPVELQVPDIDGVKSYGVRWIGWPEATTQQMVRMRVDNDGRLSGESLSDDQRVRLVLQRIVNGWQGTATHTTDGIRTVQRVQLKLVSDAMCNP
jgi:hypothetical protein